MENRYMDKYCKLWIDFGMQISVLKGLVNYTCSKVHVQEKDFVSIPCLIKNDLFYCSIFPSDFADSKMQKLFFFNAVMP